MYSFSGKVAFVTGAAGGIGRSIALRLAEDGCDVAVFDRDGDGAEATASQVRERQRRGVALIGSVTERADVDAAVRETNATLGSVDILVNNAGILRVGKVIEAPVEDWRDIFSVNVEGTLNVCQAVVPEMVERRRGTVINMASWLGKMGMRNYGGYCASKFAIIGLTQTLALEVAEHGVRVNAICPGTIVETGMRREAEEIHRSIGFPSAEERVGNIPLGRLGLPEDVAKAAAFLASDQSDYMTGQAINVTGGLWLQ